MTLRRKSARLRTVTLGITMGALVAVALLVAVTLSAAGAPTASTENGAFEKAEILHIVSRDSLGNETITWIDRGSDQVVVRRYDHDGELSEIIQRDGLVLNHYRFTHGTSGLTSRHVRTSDDPVLLRATIHLDQYRWGLTDGNVRVVAEDVVAPNGGDAILVEAWYGTEMEHSAYLDPATLYPLSQQFADGSEVLFEYPVIEVDPDNISGDAFRVDVGDVDFLESYRSLALDGAFEEVTYPVYGLSSAPEGFVLDDATHIQTRSGDREHGVSDEVALTYYKRDASGNVVETLVLKSRGPLAAHELEGRAKAEADGMVPLATVVDVNGMPAALRQDAEGSTLFWLEFEFADAYVYIQATSPETAMAAGLELQRLR